MMDHYDHFVRLKQLTLLFMVRHNNNFSGPFIFSFRDVINEFISKDVTCITLIQSDDDIIDYLEAKSRLHFQSDGPSVEKYIRRLDQIAGTVLEKPRSIKASSFPFIKDVAIQEILDRDLAEAQSDLDFRNYKSCSVMCGAILEAALIGVLRRNPQWTMDTTRIWKCNKKGTPLPDIMSNDHNDSWKLAQIIDYCCDNKIIDETKWRTALHQHLREPRNLVHPNAELRKRYTVSKDSAASSLALLKNVLEDIKNSPNLP